MGKRDFKKSGKMKTRLTKTLLKTGGILSSIVALVFCLLLLFYFFGGSGGCGSNIQSPPPPGDDPVTTPGDSMVLPLVPGDDPDTTPEDTLDLAIDTTRSGPGDKPPVHTWEDVVDGKIKAIDAYSDQIDPPIPILTDPVIPAH
jgi:hypothetical protein